MIRGQRSLRHSKRTAALNVRSMIFSASTPYVVNDRRYDIFRRCRSNVNFRGKPRLDILLPQHRHDSRICFSHTSGSVRSHEHPMILHEDRNRFMTMLLAVLLNLFPGSHGQHVARVCIRHVEIIRKQRFTHLTGIPPANQPPHK